MFKALTYACACSALIAVASLPAIGQTVPRFEPSGGWQVGQTELAGVRGIKGVKLPCIISAQYDNGFVVRLSGGGGSMLAMAVDFRQDVFKQGRKYSAMLSLGDSYVQQVSATAFTPSTLLFNLRPMKDFYGAAKMAGEMELNVDSNVMRFSLKNLSAQYAALESCYSGGNAAPVSPVMTAAKTNPAVVPAPIVEAVPPTDIAQNILKGADRQGNVSTAMSSQSSSSWTARKGETLQTVLTRWANAAGYDLDWQAAPGGNVAQDIAYDGGFEEAVAQLMAESGAATGMSAKVVADGRNNVIVGSAGGAVWNAPAGNDMRATLEQWSQKAGVAFVWTGGASQKIRQPVTANSFEGAVQTLLDQYMNDTARPVADLNTDPDTRTRTLTISTDS